MKLQIFNIGLIIVSIATAQKYDAITGWLTLGGGLMAEALMLGFLEYLHPSSTERKTANTE